MERFEIVDLLPLHRQMTLVIFRDPNTQKCEVQILPVSLEIAELQNIQAMLKIPSEPRDNAATVSVEVDEILSRRIMIGVRSGAFYRNSWCGHLSVFAVSRKTQIL